MSAPALKPPFSYYGGKTTLAPQIAKLLPQHDHYIEPFAGSLAVLLAKEPSMLETANDLDERLINFWRVLRDQPEQLEHRVRLTPQSRQEYLDSIQRMDDTTLTSLERAHAVFVVLTQGRANSLKPTGWRNDKSSKKVIPRPTILSRYTDRMAAVTKRLAGVALESMDAIEMIRYYGSEPSVCIYADPPYLGSIRSENYGIEMLEDDLHAQLASELSSCKSSVVLSGYASPLYEELYEGWYRYELKAPSNLAKNDSPNEVLWSNVPLGDQTSLF